MASTGQHDGLPSRRFARLTPTFPLNRSYGAKESTCRKNRGSSSDVKAPRIMSLLWWTLMTSMPWSPLPAALVRQRSFYTPTLNMPLRLGCPFSALILREISTATMQALQKISMVIRLLCWTSEIPLGQMVTTCSISSTSIWTSTKPIPTTWLQRQKRRSIPRSWPRH